jgi:mono/diheme cytochrome c family protein
MAPKFPAVCSLLIASAIIILITGCGPSLPPSKPLSQLTPTEHDGYLVFQGTCAKCHYPNSTRGLHGPGLQGVYKLPYLPSGAPANDARITNTIINGHGTMQGFAGKLNDQQISELVAYLHTL